MGTLTHYIFIILYNCYEFNSIFVDQGEKIGL